MDQTDIEKKALELNSQGYRQAKQELVLFAITDGEMCITKAASPWSFYSMIDTALAKAGYQIPRSKGVAGTFEKIMRGIS